MDVNAFDFLGVAITTDMASLVDHENVIIMLRGDAGKCASEKSTANDKIIIHSNGPESDGVREVDKSARGIPFINRHLACEQQRPVY